MGLSKWLFELNDKKTYGKIYWPPKDDTVVKYIERKQNPDPLTWRVYKVKVKRYKATIEEARIYLKGLINHDTNYETETNFGRGLRKKKPKRPEVESEDDEPNPKKRPLMNSSKHVPAPPQMSFVPPVQCPSRKSDRKVVVVSKGAFQRHTTNVANKERIGKQTRTALKESLRVQRNEVVPPSKSPVVAKVSLNPKKTVVSGDELKSTIVAVKSKSNDVVKLIVKEPLTSNTLNLVNRAGCSTTALSPDKSKDNFDSILRLSHNPTSSPTISPKTPVSAEITPSNGAVNNNDFAHSDSAVNNENVPQAESRPHKSYISEFFRPAVNNSQTLPEQSISICTTQGQSHPSSYSKKLPLGQESEESDVSSVTSTYSIDLTKEKVSTKSDDRDPEKDSSDDSSSVAFEGSSHLTGEGDSAFHSDAESVYSPIVHGASRGNIDTPDTIEGDVAAIRNEISCLRSDVQEANLNIARLLRYVMPHEKKIRTPPNMPTLPIRSTEAFERYEQFLDEKINFDAVVEYLSLLPIGTKEKQASMNLMARLMANNLASVYNFDGKTWKLAFKETKMWQAVEGALAKHFEKSTLEEAICGIRSWLRNAPKRDGGLPSSNFLKPKKKKKSSA